VEAIVMGLEISVKRCAAGIWDELSCTRTFLRKVFTNTKKWSLSSGVVGSRRLFVTNRLKYRDADGFLIWHSYNIIDLNE
jgi:hypothetical protein